MGVEVNDDLVGIYDHLKPEDYPAFSREEAIEWIESQQRAARKVGRAGQIRMDSERKRPVRLIEAVYDLTEGGVRIYRSDWNCKDVLSGERYRINMSKWGEVMSEMEVLAWAAQ